MMLERFKLLLFAELFATRLPGGFLFMPGAEMFDATELAS